MRQFLIAAGILVLAASPAAADLNVVYKGTESFTGKEIPAEARYAVSDGRIAVVQLGSHRSRMLFLQKEGVLRVIDDEKKSYIDFDEAQLDQMHDTAAQARSQMDAAMEKMTPEQRKMMAGMMPKGMPGMGSAPATPPTTHVKSSETATIKGYLCTRVDIMRGDEKRAEYWGTMSKDLSIDDADLATMEGLHEFLGKLTDTMSPLTGKQGGGSQGFDWDAKEAGFPVVTRCFHGDKRVLDLTMDTFDRKPADASWFEVPKGYSKQDFSLDQKPPRHGKGGLKEPKETSQ